MKNLTPFITSDKDLNIARKKIAVEVLNLIGSGNPKDALRFFSSECKTHNPYTLGGIEELTDAMIAVQKQGSGGIIKGSEADFKLFIKQVLGDGDLVAVHTQISSSKPNEGGLRQVHIFRLRATRLLSTGYHSIHSWEHA